MKILGIDPGYAILGWSIIDSKYNILNYNTIETSSDKKIDERLFIIYNELSRIITEYKPDTAAIEKLYFKKNTKTVLDVSKAIGVIILTLNLNGLNFSEYSPTEIKKTLTGYGRATKDQVQRMVKKIYNINELPKPDDAADALAIALCHALKF